MNLIEIRAELEEDRTWRMDEIRFLRNQLAEFTSEEERSLYRRALVVMLYAHFEGFCKFALLQYVRAINSMSLDCELAEPTILAASWHEVFAGLDVPEQRRVFGAALPNDPKLAKLSRRREFAQRIREFLKRKVFLPETVVDTESNLSTLVLKKNLFRLGLDIKIAERWDREIGQLLGRRNNIAHGEDRKGVSAEQYADVERAAFATMEGMMEMVMTALHTEAFRHPSPAA